jgi:hypothetical protein
MTIAATSLAVATVLVAYWVVVPIAVSILATHRPRADVAPADLGRPYNQVTVRTSDGFDLAAWYIPRATAAEEHRSRHQPSASFRTVSVT